MIYTKLVQFYRNSFVFKTIDTLISLYFRRKLTNSDFSILCPNCIGGAIYHRLGQPFLSPTINMWFSLDDFIAFLLNLDVYLKLPLVFIESNEATPVAILGGNEIKQITLHFNHASTKEIAENDWNRRKTRINKNNLYIILYLKHGDDLQKIHKLDNYPCNNKVVFTPINFPNLPWQHIIIPNPNEKYVGTHLGKNIFGVRWYEKHFDFVNFLNKR